MSSKSQQVSDYRRRRKLNLIKVCGGKCNLCGYDKIPAALEFHHIDPSQKQYAIASEGTCHDLEKDLAEVNKTILVCANCHREIHEGLFSQEFLYQKKFFDETIADELRQEKFKKTERTIHYCKNCGKEIGRGTKTELCPECYRLSTRRCERPNRETLKQLIRTSAFTSIAFEYGVTDNAVRKWCKSYGLPTRKTDIKNMSEEEWEKI